MELLPVGKTLDENEQFLLHPDCQESIHMLIAFFDTVGYVPPWIGYYAKYQGNLVGGAAFKGKPNAGSVDIAYGTFPRYRTQGIGTELCRQLVLIALKTDPAVRIMARTLPENNHSTRILTKNGFVCLGVIWDEEDGDVWEWVYKNAAPISS